ncbi:MAG: hypothetical protein GKS06_09080 [Acidobacteria bacterium]|nr:hypothetical protein [Acidobacteriota bacterium]
MAPRDTDCPKCRDRLERGFIPEQNQGVSTTNWSEGEEPMTHWYGKSIKGLKQYAVEAWRCRGCGYVELYARTEVE